MVPMRWGRMAMLSLLGLVLAGCAGGMYRQPEVTLQDVRLGGLGLSGGTLLIDLKVVNPNRFALRASQLSYDLRVRSTRQTDDTEWINFATGEVDLGTVRRFSAVDDTAAASMADEQRGFQIPARDSARVQIPIEFTYAGLGSAGMAILRYGAFSYLAEGTIHASTPMGNRRLPFRRSGTVTMAANPQ